MFGSSILEVAIGVVFIYLLLSLICSSINELIATAMDMRGRHLFEGIKNLLNDPTFTGLAQKLYNHGLIDGISQPAKDPNKPGRRPSYMASETFASALMDNLSSQYAVKSWQDIAEQRKTDLAVAQAKFDLNPRDPGIRKILHDTQQALAKTQEVLTRVDRVRQAYDEAEWAARNVMNPNDIRNLKTAKEKLQKALTAGRLLAAELPDPLDNFQKAVSDLPDGHTKEALYVVIQKTERAALLLNQSKAAVQEMEILQENIEKWFNDAMDRVSGWYKRWTQKVILGVSIVVVAISNADTIKVAERLYQDQDLRAYLAAEAGRTAGNNAADPTTDTTTREDFLRQAGYLTLPLGWGDPYQGGQVPNCRQVVFSNCIAQWGLKLIGLLMTVIAIHFGAPFWFNMLKQFVRASGAPPAEPAKNVPQAAKN